MYQFLLHNAPGRKFLAPKINKLKVTYSKQINYDKIIYNLL